MKRLNPLGGAVNLASRVDEGAIELLRPIKMLEKECRKYGVAIMTGTMCTDEELTSSAF